MYKYTALKIRKYSIFSEEICGKHKFCAIRQNFVRFQIKVLDVLCIIIRFSVMNLKIIPFIIVIWISEWGCTLNLLKANL